VPDRREVPAGALEEPPAERSKRNDPELRRTTLEGRGEKVLAIIRARLFPSEASAQFGYD